MTYREITELAEFCSLYQAKANFLTSKYLANNTSFPEVTFLIMGYEHTCFIDDEYDDLKVGSNLLSVCLILRTLESYDDAGDYLVWCTQHGFEAGNIEVQNHFKNLGKIVAWFKKNQIRIDSFISDFDFELNAGAAQYLRNNPGFKV